MPALDSRRCQLTWVLNGQASDKPQGRKPREDAARSRKAVVLWGFESWGVGTGRQRRSSPGHPCPLRIPLHTTDTGFAVHVEGTSVHNHALGKTLP
jgi:hypothetical protein